MVVLAHGNKKNPNFSLYRTVAMAHQPDRHIELLNFKNGQCIIVSLPVEIQKYYNLRDPKE
jgi:hypothetical protein